MADYKNTKKQKPVWLWIIGVTIIASFAWFVLTFVYRPPLNKTKKLAGSSFYSNYLSSGDTINEVKEFIKYTNSDALTEDDKQYAEKGIIKLQSAVSYIADRVDSTDNDLKKNIDTMDRAIAKVDISSKVFMSGLKPAFAAVVRAIESIQKLNYPHLQNEISELKKIENDINPNHSIARQTHYIQKFFNTAAVTMKRMKLSADLKYM